MAIALTRFSQWMLRGDQKHKKKQQQQQQMRESEPVKVHFSNLSSPSASASSSPSSASASSSSSRRMRKRRGTSRTKRIDRDHDMVIVPSDGGACISGSESDGSDWSIGWLEPHPHDFCTSDAESEDSFAVLVPCYRPLPLPSPAHASTGAGARAGTSANPLVETPEGLSLSESNEFLQHWLSSLASDRLL